jgi:hypothetical protein
MWLFAQRGFLSIVEDANNKERLIVRGRVDGDIEQYFPDALIVSTPEHDYAYRAFLPKKPSPSSWPIRCVRSPTPNSSQASWIGSVAPAIISMCGV